MDEDLGVDGWDGVSCWCLFIFFGGILFRGLFFNHCLYVVVEMDYLVE